MQELGDRERFIAEQRRFEGTWHDYLAAVRAGDDATADMLRDVLAALGLHLRGGGR